MKHLLFCLVFLCLSLPVFAQTPTEPTRTTVPITSSAAWTEIVDHIDTGLWISVLRGSAAIVCLTRSLDCTVPDVARCPWSITAAEGWAYVPSEGWHRKICGRLFLGSPSGAVETEGWK